MFLCYDAQEVIIFTLTLKGSAFQRWSILQTLKQAQNLMLKQRWFWVDTKTNFVLMLNQQAHHVESTSTGKHRRIFMSFRHALLM